MKSAPNNFGRSSACHRFAFLCLMLGTQMIASRSIASESNLLRNAGFEEMTANPASAAGWSTRSDSTGKPLVSSQEAHSGMRCLAIPGRSAIEQSIPETKPGAYLARCWIKSQADQRVTLVLQDPARPWKSYSWSEIKVPKGQWTQIETFCVLNQKGDLTLSIGGMSPENRIYHGAGSDMPSPIVIDDIELIRYEPNPRANTIWDITQKSGEATEWAARSQWKQVTDDAYAFKGSPAFQAGQIAGAVRNRDGGLILNSVREAQITPRATIVPSPFFKVGSCNLIRSNEQTGVHIQSEDGQHGYTAWITSNGVVRIESKEIASFSIRDCAIRYGILPSFAGSDICYDSAKYHSAKQVNLPSTQWFVGLLEGGESMMTTTWDSDTQKIALGVDGEKVPKFNTLTIGTAGGGFAVAFAEHSGLWHKEALQEDWLGDYTSIGWERPFQARWMAHFFVSPGGEPSFHDPYMNYSFPIAQMKTRMWGVWFEDWNHYPFYFDGPRTTVHFEKSFTPKGDALFYFLEPAAAELISPVEALETALGKEKAAAILDFDANRIRKLDYSTPDDFMYDRPVCATTTRLSHIKQEEKGTVGVNLVTHLYEFIRGIRGRVDQYVAFSTQMKAYLAEQKARRPELENYIKELETIISDAQSKTGKIYATPLTAVQAKTDSMKKLLEEGKGDGFDCGSLDVRSPAGAQDDLCRRYNRAVLRLEQTAALGCDESAEKAAIAKYIWDQSRAVLRQPTRWEPRRTLYFFEP